MPRAALDYPPRLPVDRGALPQLIDALTFGFLEPERAPFAAPDDVLTATVRLTFHRLCGAARRGARGPATLPEAPLSGLLEQGTPFAYLAVSDGREISISIGAQAEHSAAFARGVSSLMGGPPPVAHRVTQAHLVQASYGCLFGWPALLSTPEASGGHAALDLVLDGLRGTPLLFLIFATPEVPQGVCDRITALRQAAELIDRSYLKADAQANADRLALRACTLLDGTVRRLQDGLGEGLWRTSIIAGAPDAGALRFALATLAGSLRARRRDVAVPLRGHGCAPAADGYGVHSNVLRQAELAALCMLPRRDRLGFAVQPRVAFDIDHPAHPALAEGVKVGAILDGVQEAGRDLFVPTSQLCRHVLVAGHTGSGKSTTLRALLLSLGRRGLPFLILDPVKPAEGEYGALAALLPDLVLLRAGAVAGAGATPLLLNPFEFPVGFSLFTHIDLLKAAFTAAFGLSPPAPYLLETAIYRAYERRGWDLTAARHRHGADRLAFPTLGDLLAEIETVIEEAGYGEEISRNLKGALRTRLGSLCLGPKGLSLDTRHGLPDELLFDRQVLIELRHLGSVDEQALVMGLLLIRLWEHRQAAGIPPVERLRHLVVIEEAHRLLRRTAERAAEDGNMAHQALQVFVNLIAEVRAYGQGLLVAEQLPSNLTPDVIKQVGLKVVHRLTPREDRDLVGDAMALRTAQKRALVTLRTGQAVVHGEGMDGAICVRVEAPQPGASAPDGTEWARRLRRQLSAPLAGELDRLLGRVQLRIWLDRPEVRRHADSAIASLVCGMAGAAERAALSACVETALRSAAGPAGVREQITLAALEEALLRRALFHGWREATWEEARRGLGAGRTDLGALLRKALAREAGPHPFCAACPAPCRFGYEGWTLGRDQTFQQDVVAAIRGAGGEDLGTALVEAQDAAQSRLLPGCGTLPRGIGHCAVGHVAIRLRLAPHQIEAVLDRFYRAREEAT